MIIVCSGPDTFRARERARELVAAFRAKHDPQGLSTEVVNGEAGLDAILPRLGSVSLFSTKRMIRADGLLESLKIADVRKLAEKLRADGDLTVVLTVETEPPNAKTLESFKDAKCFHYPHPLLMGASFKTWVRERPEAGGVPKKTVDAIADRFEGDSWSVLQELRKQAANPQPVETATESTGGVFDVAEAVMKQTSGWRRSLAIAKDDNAISIIVSQLRSFVRVRDGATRGLHPFVVKKLGWLKTDISPARFISVLRAQVATRSGLATGEEADALIQTNT